MTQNFGAPDAAANKPAAGGAVAAKYLLVPQGDKGLSGEATAGRRIGLYGGSFNPPHKGHILVAQMALDRLKLDEVWWLVSPGNPLKDNSGLPPLVARIKAAAALTAANPRIKLTGFEQILGNHSTAPMLRYIAAANPLTHFVWIMGADNLQYFHLWQDWRQIMATMPLAVINRPHFADADKSPAAEAFAAARINEAQAAQLADMPPPAWVFLHGRHSYLSSTLLRARRKTAINKG